MTTEAKTKDAHAEWRKAETEAREAAHDDPKKFKPVDSQKSGKEGKELSVEQRLQLLEEVVFVRQGAVPRFSPPPGAPTIPYDLPTVGQPPQPPASEPATAEKDAKKDK